MPSLSTDNTLTLFVGYYNNYTYSYNLFFQEQIFQTGHIIRRQIQ